MNRTKPLNVPLGAIDAISSCHLNWDAIRSPPCLEAAEAAAYSGDWALRTSEILEWEA
jgi:hypothetical protein